MCYRSVNCTKFACGHLIPIDGGVKVDCNKSNCINSRVHQAKGPCSNCTSTCTQWLKEARKVPVSAVNGACTACRR
ncbi:hypothetical protein C8J55DRAFT_241235 [Lentinula edodes]|uniref:Uncharacterized protein n=1 Tax=Lentinula lateritia TaxID=40482 RepID=A0A9W8ZTA9_9AGAR|nr:hypothetical protein C8J55DRAFT_241235 [Lentinula edodes]